MYVYKYIHIYIQYPNFYNINVYILRNVYFNNNIRSKRFRVCALDCIQNNFRILYLNDSNKRMFFHKQWSNHNLQTRHALRLYMYVTIFEVCALCNFVVQKIRDGGGILYVDS
jgi:hypothetical protein